MDSTIVFLGASRGATSMNSRPSRLSIPPQLGTEIGRPNPKKLSAASLIITAPTLMVKMMMIGAPMLDRYHDVDRGRRQTDGQRDLSAEDKAAQEVSAQLVGPQQVPVGGGLHPVYDVYFIMRKRR